MLLVNDRKRNIGYKEYKFDNPLITKTDSMFNSCYRDCHNKCFHNFIYEFIYDIKLKNVTTNEIFILTLSDKSMNLLDLNKTLKVARQNGFSFYQINKLTVKFYSHLQ